MVDLKIVHEEFLGPSDVVRTQVLGIYELAKIVILNEDKKLQFTTSI